jgi:elongation factor G
MIEKIVENDESMMNRYFEGQELSLEELKAATRKAVIANQLVPVFAGTALRNKGVQLVLDAVIDYLPAPTDVPAIKGVDPKTGEEIVRESSDNKPFAALAFQIATDPFVGTLSILPCVFRDSRSRFIYF